MAEQIRFFEKSKCDISEDNVTASATQGDDYVLQILNRSNNSAWITTGSVDADNTTIEVDMTDERNISEIFLLKHNFRSFTVKYWNGSAWTAFSPAIAPTTNTAENNHYSVTEVSTSKIQIVILGTQTANDDKFLYQFVATNEIGQLAGWPVIDNVVHGTNLKKSTLLSGKNYVTRNVGGFSCTLSVKGWNNDADLSIIESLYDSVDGFLVWLCGGDEDQFSSVRRGYRMEDLFLMKCMDDYNPDFSKGLYQSGLEIKIKLGEVVP